MNNPQAFPVMENDFDAAGQPRLILSDPGMTLLDYFAGQAMQKAITTRPSGIKNWIKWVLGKPYCANTIVAEQNAIDSYKAAAAMLKAREQYINNL